MDIFDKICRSCNNERKNMVNIFDTKLISYPINVEKMFSTCSRLPVDINDDYPKNICYLCIKQLEISYKFLIQTYRSKKQFDRIIEHLNSKPSQSEWDQQLQTPQGPQKRKPSQSEKEEHIIIATDDHIIEQPITTDEEIEFISEETPGRDSLHLPPACLKDENTQFTEVQDLVEPEEKISCPQCSKNFFTAKALLLHRKISHKNTSSQDFNTSNRSSQVYGNTALLKHDKKVRSPAKNYNCEICSKSFLNKSNLNQHWQQHL